MQEVETSVADEVLRRIDQLGELISQGAVAGWEILVRQQYVSGIGYLILAIAIASVTLYVRSWARKRADLALDMLRDSEHPDRGIVQRRGYMSIEETIVDDVGGFGLLALVMTALSFSSLLPLYAAVGRFMNPGYYAIKEVLEIFG